MECERLISTHTGEEIDSYTEHAASHKSDSIFGDVDQWRGFLNKA